MAETRTNQPEKSSQALTRHGREQRDLERWGTFASSDPFDFMSRMSEEMDRTFDRLWRDFGLQRRRSSQGQRLFGHGAEAAAWAPRIEAFHKGDQFIVRVDLPGLTKEEVDVEVTDDALTIRGERKVEQEEKREGYFHTEREYGQFYRVIPLPEGVIADNAKASFRDGVLEVRMPAAPAETSHRRKLEIKDASEVEQKK